MPTIIFYNEIPRTWVQVAEEMRKIGATEVHNYSRIREIPADSYAPVFK